MKISCLMGSPRPESNSAAIAGKFAETAAALGASVEKIVLNDLDCRGCQGCMACKTGSECCVLEDGLSAVLESLKSDDVIVMAMPVYCSDVPGQVKCFIDRTFSCMKPHYMAEPAPSRVPGGKKLVLILAQGASAEEMFADIPNRYTRFLSRSMGFSETHVIRAVGVGRGGAVGVPEECLHRAESLARSMIQP